MGLAMIQEHNSGKDSLQRIDHVALVVVDIDSAVQWYRDRFHCAVEWHDASWAYLRFENCGLALVTPGQHPPHVAIQSDHLTVFGKPIKHRDGTQSVYLADRDGNVVEVLQRDTARAS